MENNVHVCSLIIKVNIVKMASLPTAMYRFKAALIKILVQFLVDIEKQFQISYRITNDSGVKINNLEQKIPSDVTTLDFNLNCRATAIILAWHWQKID